MKANQLGKYGADEGGWFMNKFIKTHGWSVSKCIYKVEYIIKRHTNLVIGRGNRFLIWQDSWCGDSSLA